MLKSRMKTNSNFRRISHVYCPKYRIITGGSVIKDYKSVSQKSLLFSKKCCQMTAACCHMTTLRTTPQEGIKVVRKTKGVNIDCSTWQGNIGTNKCKPIINPESKSVKQPNCSQCCCGHSILSAF